MVSLKDADAMICGLNRSYALSLESIEYVLDPIPNKTILGLTVMLCNGEQFLLLIQMFMICRMPRTC
jgi:malate dehydrogenase (oxaloacetate-decarboxylating)(NADP+)